MHSSCRHSWKPCLAGRLRAGWKWGVPALGAAGFVGYSRIKGQKHFTDDVIAGAGIALMYNWLFTKPLGENVWIKPKKFYGGGYGVAVQVDPGGSGTDSGRQRRSPTDFNYRLAFEFGAVNGRRLDVQAPPGEGTLIGLDAQQQNITATSRLKFEWMFRRPHEFNFFWAPIEARDFDAVPKEDVSFGGVTFPAGVPTAARFRFDEIGFRYRYGLVDNRWVGVRVGTTLAVRETLASIEQELPDTEPEPTELEAEESEFEVLPLLHLHLNLKFNEQFGIVAEGDWMRFSKDRWSRSGYAAFQWRPRPRWALDFGYRNLTRNRRSDTLATRIGFDYLFLGVGYAF